MRTRFESGNTAARDFTKSSRSAPDCRPKRFVPAQPHETSGEHDANKANLPGATLARRPMESRAQLAEGRGRQRKRGGGEGLRSPVDRTRNAHAASRAGPRLRRSQTTQRYVILRREIDRRPAARPPAPAVSPNSPFV